MKLTIEKPTVEASDTLAENSKKFEISLGKLIIAMPEQPQQSKQTVNMLGSLTIDATLSKVLKGVRGNDGVYMAANFDYELPLGTIWDPEQSLNDAIDFTIATRGEENISISSREKMFVVGFKGRCLVGAINIGIPQKSALKFAVFMDEKTPHGCVITAITRDALDADAAAMFASLRVVSGEQN